MLVVILLIPVMGIVTTIVVIVAAMRKHHQSAGQIATGMAVPMAIRFSKLSPRRHFLRLMVSILGTAMW